MRSEQRPGGKASEQGGKVVVGNEVREVRRKGRGLGRLCRALQSTVRTRFSLSERGNHCRALNRGVTETILICERFALATTLREDYWEEGRVE